MTTRSYHCIENKLGAIVDSTDDGRALTADNIEFHVDMMDSLDPKSAPHKAVRLIPERFGLSEGQREELYQKYRDFFEAGGVSEAMRLGYVGALVTLGLYTEFRERLEKEKP